MTGAHPLPEMPRVAQIRFSSWYGMLSHAVPMALPPPTPPPVDATVRWQWRAGLC